MRKLLLALALCLLPSLSWAALSLDGSASGGVTAGNSTVPTTGSLTTAGTNDIIVAFVMNYDDSGAAALAVSSIAGGSLSWSRKYQTGSTLVGGAGHVNLEIWYAKSSGVVSGATITATYPSSVVANADIVVFGVNGADTTTPFDTNASLPAKASVNGLGTPTVSGVSTTNANTMMIAAAVNGVGLGNHGTGYTTINVANVNGTDNEYKIFSSVQSGISVAFTSADSSSFGYVMAVAALQQATAPGTTPFIFTPAIVP